MEHGAMHATVKPDEEVPCGFVYSICPSGIFPCKYSSDEADLLKINSFAQPNFLIESFAQRNGPKMP